MCGPAGVHGRQEGSHPCPHLHLHYTSILVPIPFPSPSSSSSWMCTHVHRDCVYVQGHTLAQGALCVCRKTHVCVQGLCTRAGTHVHTCVPQSLSLSLSRGRVPPPCPGGCSFLGLYLSRCPPQGVLKVSLSPQGCCAEAEAAGMWGAAPCRAPWPAPGSPGSAPGLWHTRWEPWEGWSWWTYTGVWA